MKDSDLRGIILQKFYEHRRHISRMWQASDAPEGILPEDFFGVCQQLAENGLIDSKPSYKNDRGTRKIILVIGQITAQGIDVVEGNTKPPISLTVAYSQPVNISNSSNVQVGDNNSMSNLINVEKLTAAIDRSNFSIADKAEAKSRLNKFLEHPLVAALAGSVVSAGLSKL